MASLTSGSGGRVVEPGILVLVINCSDGYWLGTSSFEAIFQENWKWIGFYLWNKHAHDPRAFDGVPRPFKPSNRDTRDFGASYIDEPSRPYGCFLDFLARLDI
jgi:hypothetical protein